MAANVPVGGWVSVSGSTHYATVLPWLYLVTLLRQGLPPYRLAARRWLEMKPHTNQMHYGAFVASWFVVAGTFRQQIHTAWRLCLVLQGEVGLPMPTPNRTRANLIFSGRRPCSRRLDGREHISGRTNEMVPRPGS